MRLSCVLQTVFAMVVWLSSVSSSLAAQQTTLFRFPNQSTGVYPFAGVIIDANGDMYGTTFEGGADNYGTVFKLVPPAKNGKTWTEHVLYSFTGGNDGLNPYTAVTLDGSGNLYGTAQHGQYHTATIFELSPNGNAWTFNTIFSFDPSVFGNAYLGSPLIFDKAGNLYGESEQGGQYQQGFIYQLSPPAHQGAPWTGSIIYSFRGAARGEDGGFPNGGLLFDSAGNIYGVTTYSGVYCKSNCQHRPCRVEGCGTVFRLQPPAHKGGAWTESVLYRFQGKADGAWPEGGVMLDSSGNLYGTTTGAGNKPGNAGFGTVFELVPQSGKWVDKTIFTFQTTLIDHPYSGVVMDSSGKLYGTTWDGGKPKRCGTLACGTVYQLTPSRPDGTWTLTVLHGFAGAPDGTSPFGNLVLQGGKLYGTTAYGGDEKTQECKDAGGCGLIYQTTP